MTIKSIYCDTLLLTGKSILFFFFGPSGPKSIIFEMKILSFTIITLLALIVPISAVECKYISTISAKHKPDPVHLQLIWCHSVLSIQCSLL